MYKLTKDGAAVIFTDGDNSTYIPLPADGLAGQRYIDWLAEGNTPEPYTPSAAEANAPIFAQLATLDAKSIRALREGDASRIAAIEAEAVALRAQLVK